MIKGHCHTNLDDYDRAQWPEKFAAVPEIGSKVEAKSGAKLRVIDITHTTITQHVLGELEEEPYIKVELYK